MGTTMTMNHIPRHPQQSVVISTRFQTKLLALFSSILLLTHSLVPTSDAKPDDDQRIMRRRRHLQSEDCMLNSYGVYGSIPTSDTATLNVIYNIEYLYQVSVTVGTVFSGDILRPIDGVITTEIIPFFFPNCNNNRFLQVTSNNSSSEAIITAISSTPVDTYVPSGLPCPKTVSNTDCYVVQGLSTVIGIGERDDDYVQSTFQLALQSVLQNNAIVPLLSTTTNVVVDISALTDSLETPPPIILQPQAPVSAPLPTPPLASPTSATSPVAGPVAVTAPTRLTFAPIPELNPPSITIVDPTMSPRAITSASPSRAPVNIPTTLNSTTTSVPVAGTNAPVANTEDAEREQQSNSKDGLKWWAWLLIIFGALSVAFCGYSAYSNQRDETTNVGGHDDNGGGTGSGLSRIGMLTPNPTSNSKKGNSKGSRDTEDDDDDEEVPYEPPSGMDQYIPPPTMALMNASINNLNSDNITITSPANHNDKNNDYPTHSLPTVPYFASNIAPTSTFINNALDDESDEDEDENTADIDHDDGEIEYENDGYRDEEVEYTDEGDEEDDVDVDHHNHHEDGELFDDEESYYEEEEEEDEDEEETFGEESYPSRNNGPGGGNNWADGGLY